MTLWMSAYSQKRTFKYPATSVGSIPLSTLAGLRIEESDKDGLRLRAYRPFPPGRVAKERDLGPEGTQTPENGKMRVSESTTRVEAA